MAVTVDPFSLATVELSEDFVNIFPSPQIVPNYLAEVSDKTGIVVLTYSKPISIRGSWVALKRIRSYLTEFSVTYNELKLEDHKDTHHTGFTNTSINENLSLVEDAVEDTSDFEEFDQKPNENHNARFPNTTNELSEWAKWTAEVLPQIQRTRSKRALEYYQPQADINKVPEPLVVYANCQPAPDPGAKVQPTLDAIEKVLKTVYDKERTDELPRVSSSEIPELPETKQEVDPSRLIEGFLCLTNQHSTIVSNTQTSDISDHKNKLDQSTTSDNSTVCNSSDSISRKIADLQPVVYESESPSPIEGPTNATDDITSKSVSTQDDCHKPPLNQNRLLPVAEQEKQDHQTKTQVRRSKRKRTKENNLESPQICADSPTVSMLKNAEDPKDLATSAAKSKIKNKSDVNLVQLVVDRKARRKGIPKKKKRYEENSEKIGDSNVEKLETKASVDESVNCKTKRLVQDDNAEFDAQSEKKKPRKAVQPKPVKPVSVKEELKPVKDYFCELCPYIAKKLGHLREHKRRVHITKDKEFKCDECNKVFGFAKDLKRHSLTHQKAENCCDICGKMYKGSRNLAEHKKTHDTNYLKPEFPCEFCPKTFSTKYVLAYHIKSEHLGMKKTFLCPTCGKSFSQKSSYLQHANVHMGIKPHQCDICGRSFSYEKSLKEHKYMHQDDKQFECPVCHKKFRQSSGVAIHMKIHQERKDYVCSACGKGFSQKQAMVRHERIHIGEKPFACVLCKRTFTDSSILRRHMILIHKKDKDKWQEDTKKNVHRRTDFFISVVGQDKHEAKSDSVLHDGSENIVMNNENNPAEASINSSIQVTDDHTFIETDIATVTSVSLVHNDISRSDIAAVNLAAGVSLPQCPLYSSVCPDTSVTDTRVNIQDPDTSVHKLHSVTDVTIHAHDPNISVQKLQSVTDATVNVHDPNTSPVQKLHPELALSLAVEATDTATVASTSLVSHIIQHHNHMQHHQPGMLNSYTFSDRSCPPTTDFGSDDLPSNAGVTEQPGASYSTIVLQDNDGYHADMIMMPDALTLHFHAGDVNIHSDSQLQTAELEQFVNNASVHEQKYSDQE